MKINFDHPISRIRPVRRAFEFRVSFVPINFNRPIPGRPAGPVVHLELYYCRTINISRSKGEVGGSSRPKNCFFFTTLGRQLARAPILAWARSIRRELTRQESAEFFTRSNCKARTVRSGEWEKGPILHDLRSEIRLGGSVRHNRDSEKRERSVCIGGQWNEVFGNNLSKPPSLLASRTPLTAYRRTHRRNARHV